MRLFVTCCTLLLLAGCASISIDIGSFSFINGGGGEDAEKPAEPRADAKKPSYDWVFYYYMAYDNNLEGCGRPILDMLKDGVVSEKIAVVTYADFRDKKGMKRYVASKSGDKVTETETLLETEASAEEATLESALNWTRENYPAKHYAIIFLDHGNRLDEMSLDEYPGKEGAKNWLKLPQVAPVLAKFRKQVENRLELVFIQQCGKGALENYHAMRDAAPFVMASQTVVGAPNYYYTEALKEVCAKPDIDGKALAALFTNHETDNMFTTYTTLNEKALGELAKQLDAALKPLVELKEIAQPAILPERARRGERKPEGASVRMCFMPAKDEQFCDGLAWLEAMYDANKLDKKPCEAFAKYVKEELVSIHRCSPPQKQKAGAWCGFSIYIPANAKALERYKDYPIYKDTQLDELLARLVR